MDDKVIVTNRAALTAKYGASGVKKINAAVAALVAADAKRGVKTRLLHLDDAAAMKKLGFEPRIGTPQEFAEFIRNEIKIWTPAAKAAGILPK